MGPLGIKKLVEDARVGKKGAVEELFSRHRNDLRQAIEIRLDSNLNQRLDASDIIQETFAEATRRLPDYLKNQPVSPYLWLRQIAQDKIIMARRHHLDRSKRSVRKEVPLSEQSSVQLAKCLMGTYSTPSEHLSRKEQIERLREGMNQLAEMDREIVLMRNLEQLSFKEIGYIFNLSSSAANMRHVRALLKLSKSLFNGGFTESQI